MAVTRATPRRCAIAAEIVVLPEPESPTTPISTAVAAIKEDGQKGPRRPAVGRGCTLCSHATPPPRRHRHSPHRRPAPRRTRHHPSRAALGNPPHPALHGPVPRHEPGVGG